MESGTRTESNHSSPTRPTVVNSSTSAHCSVVPSDSMKDMDWLNSIELKRLNDTTKVGYLDGRTSSTNNYSTDYSIASTENDVFEKKKNNLLNNKNIRCIIEKIRAKTNKEKIDFQLLEKLTKLLNASPDLSDHRIIENNENNLSFLNSSDDSKSDHKDMGDFSVGLESHNSHINQNEGNYVLSEDLRKLLTTKNPPARGDNVVDEDKLKPLDYKNDNTLKPPYSYSTLIKMAMKSNHKECITLLNIYDWIKTNFAYYRNIDSCWQNSIRHNLSLNKCFVRVPRESGDHGKGGYWKYVESNDTSDSRYSAKTYSRSLSSNENSLNCYRSKKYHRRNNKNLSVIVQPFDQFQPQQIIQPQFTNTNISNISNISNINNIANIQNQFNTFIKNNTNNLYGYQNPYVSPPTTNIYNVQRFGENNTSILNDPIQKMPQYINNIELSSIYNDNTGSNQMMMSNENILVGKTELKNNQTNIGTNVEEVNPILEAMKYPLTYYNNLAQSTNNFLANDAMSNNVIDREFSQNMPDNTTTQFNTQNNPLSALPLSLFSGSGSGGEITNQYSIDFLNSLIKPTSGSSYELLQHTIQENTNPIINSTNYNTSNNSLTENTSDISGLSLLGLDAKSISSLNPSNSASFNGNDLYNYYLNELGISQQQQINPQIQRLYNVLGENNFHQP